MEEEKVTREPEQEEKKTFLNDRQELEHLLAEFFYSHPSAQKYTMTLLAYIIGAMLADVCDSTADYNAECNKLIAYFRLVFNDCRKLMDKKSQITPPMGQC